MSNITDGKSSLWAADSLEATLTPQPDLLPFIADYHLAYLLPIVIY